MKRNLRALVVLILGWQVRRLRKKADFKIVGVVGSIGKTSTKVAIADVLAQKYRVRYQHGNYNDIVSVPLVLFGHTMPSLFNPLAWIGVFWRNELALRSPYMFEIVVLELGTDAPTQIEAFQKYLSLDIAVVSAITAEHLENFHTLNDVMHEELAVQNYSKEIFINTDLAPKTLAKHLHKDWQSYGKQAKDFVIEQITERGWSIVGEESLPIRYRSISDAQIYSLSAAAIVGRRLGLSIQQIQAGVESNEPVAGRMNILAGKNGTTIIDDSYNSSPVAVEQALKALTNIKGPYKLALLGNMNELGEQSAKLHAEVGALCSPKNLDLLVTLGPDANEHLANAAEERGCKVVRTKSPYHAGQVLLEHLKPKSVVLVKGSQNGVFAEEAVKVLLENPKDQSKLVRQSKDWMSIKRKQF